MKLFKWIALAVVAFVLVAPGSAFAQGGAAGDQYSEQIPEAGGGHSGGGSGGPGNHPNPLSPDTTSGGHNSSNSGPSAESSSPSVPTAPTTTSGDNGAVNPGDNGAVNPSTVKNNANKHGDKGAAANLAQQTAPDSKALSDATEQAQTGAGSSNGVFGTAADDSGSGGGLGVILLIVLAVTAAAGAAYWLWRRRRDQRDHIGEGSASSA